MHNQSSLFPVIVVPTTVIRLPLSLKKSFLEFVESEEIKESVELNTIEYATDDLFFDVSDIGSCELLHDWFSRRHCEHLRGCRVTVPERLFPDVLIPPDYLWCRWETSRTILVVGNAAEIAIIIELMGCATVYQKEFSFVREPVFVSQR